LELEKIPDASVGPAVDCSDSSAVARSSDDGMGLYLHHAPELYSGHVQNAMGTDVVGSFTAARLFACLFFLQGITITGVFGSNSLLWSLANELWYYVMFPLGLIALRPSFRLKARIASAALFLLIAFFVGRQILSLFPIWLLGSVLAALRVPRFRGTLRTLTILLYPFLFFFLAKFRLIPGAASDYILGVATYLFLICLLQSDYVAPTARWVTVSRLGSRFSYTLYAVHFPFLLLLTSFLAGDQLWHPTLPHLSVAAVLVPGVVVYAFAIAWLTEFRTDRVRSWVESRILPMKLPEEKTVS
jgi:peptidoglycan/LPS O-acetylase OafA/YrhL